MSAPWKVAYVAIGLAFCMNCSIALAGPPDFLPFRPRVEADARKTYSLDDTHGPWMIMVGSFSGADGERMARDLVLEIRKELRLKAYMYRHQIDLEDTSEGLGWQQPADRRGQPIRQRMRLLNLGDFEEIAVLVGDFDSHESKKIQKTLLRIKQMQPTALRDESDPRAAEAFRQRKNKMHFDLNREKELGPLRSAFITPNPKLPEQYFNPGGPDRFIYNLNKDLEFSLLTCPGKFTVRVRDV